MWHLKKNCVIVSWNVFCISHVRETSGKFSTEAGYLCGMSSWANCPQWQVVKCVHLWQWHIVWSMLTREMLSWASCPFTKLQLNLKWLFQELLSSSPQDVSKFVWFEPAHVSFAEPLKSEMVGPAHYVTIVPITMGQLVGQRVRPDRDGLGQKENTMVLDKMRIRI